MPPGKKQSKSTGTDIRAFFGGGGSLPTSQSKSSLKSSRGEPIEIDDSDEDADSQVVRRSAPAPSPKKPSPKKPQATPPRGTASTPTQKRKKALISSDEDEDEPPRKHPATSSPASATKTPATKRKKAVVISNDEEEEEEELPVKKKPTPKQPSATPATKSKPRAKPRASTSSSAKNKKRVEDDDFDDGAEEEEEEDDDDDFIVPDDEDDDAPKKKRAAPRKSAGKPPAKSAPRKAKAETSAKEKPDATADKSGTEGKPKAKSNWAAIQAAKLAGPSAPGSKTIPEPASPDCLAGLTFVFTGQLTSLAREEAIDLAKRYGGRVTGQPSSKTSYVVVGADAGASKLAAIKKNHLPMLDEDGFLNLIATREGPGDADEKTKKKRDKERAEMEKAAKEMEAREKARAKAASSTSAKGKGKVVGVVKTDPTTQLWTDRYAPQTLKEVCGNKSQVERLLEWLQQWPDNVKCNFKKPGKSGAGIFHGILISGPPGIGKTTSAHLCAKLAGFVPIELNASDVRSKKLVESSMNISNTSLDGWMGGGQTTNVAGVTITDKSCLIMDEVDGMSAGDRGGVGALAALIRKSKIPVICIANDRQLPKMKPLTNVTFNMSFRKPEALSIRSRIMSIAFKEKMKIPANVIDQLVTGVNSDIRQVLNMLSTWKLRSDTMDFDEGKALAKMNEKYAVMSPFNIIYEILGPNMWERTSRKTLGDKMELYFQDYSFVPLFMQENYLKTSPSRVRNFDGPEKQMKELELMDKAASSLSDSDLVDALIHGSEQHWTLMPTHAVLSTVRPASFMHGPGGGYGSARPMSFPQWLGQNSKQNKLSRQLSELQVHMRLKVSGDKSEIRQSYIPALHPHLVQPLAQTGASAVDSIIETMDDYYISREDWDTLVELGVDEWKDDLVLKKISTATKAAFTKKYNAKEHPIAFYKAEDLGKAPKKLLDAGPAPDLEEAFDIDDEVPDDEDDKKAAAVDPDDISSDKLIVDKAAKAKQKATEVGKGAKAKTKPKK